jgi:hypothetical protein
MDAGQCSRVSDQQVQHGIQNYAQGGFAHMAQQTERSINAKYAKRLLMCH